MTELTAVNNTGAVPDSTGDLDISLSPAIVTDSGLTSLMIVARYLEIPVDAEILARMSGAGSGLVSEPDLLRLAQSIGLEGTQLRCTPTKLRTLPMPLILPLANGRFGLAISAAETGVVVHNPVAGAAATIAWPDLKKIWSGRVLTFRRAGEEKQESKFSVSWLLAASAKYWRIFAQVLTASVALQLFALVTPLMFQVVIDKVLAHRGLTTLDVVAIGLFCAAVFEIVLTMLRSYILSHTTNRLDVELGAGLFRRLLSLPLSYFENRRVGESVARLRELETVRQFFTGSALTASIDGVFAAIFIAVMYIYSPLLAGIVIATLPVYFLISYIVTPWLRRRLDQQNVRHTETQSFMVELLGGIETLKALAVEPRIQRRFEENLAGATAASFRAEQLSQVAGQAVAFVSKLTTVALLWYGALLVIKGDLSVGQLIAFNMLAGRVAAPILRLAQVLQEFQRVRLSIERLADIMNSPSEIKSGTTSALPKLQGRVVFEHVSFRYAPDAPEAISDLSLTIAPGQIVGIVGPSGSGKSTLAKLVQRLYVPERGRILIDGIDVARVESAWLRSQIGVVLQENVLFNMSVRENIALADPTASIERVSAAAALAGAHDFILELPQGYDTPVGERGMTLSGGQRQRLALARALLTDPRLLILDEATSALDSEAEQIVQANMQRISSGRTVIMIAHRLSTLRSCDFIVTLEKGRVTEQGAHGALLAGGGKYALLHKLQTEGGAAHGTN